MTKELVMDLTGTIAEIESLIARLREEEGCLDLDAAIGVVIGRAIEPLPNYTTSLDAASTLLPITKYSHHPGYLMRVAEKEAFDVFEWDRAAFIKHYPRYLCIAALENHLSRRGPE